MPDVIFLNKYLFVYRMHFEIKSIELYIITANKNDWTENFLLL